jgi:TonB family protein
MFNQLIGSRPARTQSARGTTFSVAVHGMVFTTVILLSAEGRKIADPLPSRVVPLAPYVEPRVDPRPPRPVPPSPKQPTPAEPVPVKEPAPPVPVISVVPTDIPVPATEPVGEPAAPEPVVGQSSEPGTGEPGFSDPYNGALGTSEVDLAAALMPRSPLPRYPEALRQMRLEGAARARFVVGTDGRVEMSTLVILDASHPAFAEALRAALPRMRFRAARIGSQRVRQLVEFPVGFKLER